MTIVVAMQCQCTVGHPGPSPEQSEIIPLRICNALVRGPRVSVVASVQCTRPRSVCGHPGSGRAQAQERPPSPSPPPCVILFSP